MSEFVMESSILDQKLTTISNTIPDVKYEKYIELKECEDDRKIIVQPKGDIDTINILENPEEYGMDLKKAFSMLENDGKRIGVSILYRFDDKNTLEEIKNTIRRIY